MVKTRIAPSPTGDPHVGTVYQALFNYVFAKQQSGHFIVRIEDTDRTRFNPTSQERILTMLEWLKISPDESPVAGGENGPYIQSERLQIYREHADLLLKSGAAYRAFDTAEELAAAREAAKAAGNQGAGYNRAYRDYSVEDAEKRAAAGEPHVVRLKVPLEGKTIVNDFLRGEVEFDNTQLDDKVILKADGFPTYHLAAMVDDHLMGISHVIRAEEWLTSTPFHILILRAFGWNEPIWVHTPLLRNPDKSKLSKRKMDTSVESYKEQGFLPEALLNYLGMMAWSFPDGRDVFSLQEMIENFSLERMSTGGPIFALEKLRWLNGKYIREILSTGELAICLEPFMQKAGLTSPSQKFLENVVDAQKARFETLQEFVDKSVYFFSENYPVSEKAQAKIDEGKELFPKLSRIIQSLPDLLPETSEAAFKEFSQIQELKMGSVMQPLRAALTGSLETPSMFEVMMILGTEKVLARILRFV